MKIAFHFDADSELLGCCYGDVVHERIFTDLLQNRNLIISSKIFIGDLLFGVYSSECIAEEYDEYGSVKLSYRMNDDGYKRMFERWIMSVSKGWNTFDMHRLIGLCEHNIYTVCFESIDKKTALYIDNALRDFTPYLGAANIMEYDQLQWILYGMSLVPFGRIVNRSLNVFYDEWQTPFILDSSWVGIFDKVTEEKLNLRYTIFDKYHDYSHARRVAEWKENCGSMLAFVADDVVSRISDIAPDISDKLWAALTGFEGAETNEQYAQVMTSCRRIFEYVVDRVAPESDELTESGHSIKKNKYRNRLYEYAMRCRKSDADIDMILASLDHLTAQWDKLNALANKGVHAEVYREEAGRCFIRTILLLEDIVSLRKSPFPIQTEFKEPEETDIV